MLFIIAYSFNLTLGLVTFITALYGFKKLKNKFQILPRSLKTYLQVCALPYIMIVNFASIYCGIIFLIFNKETILGIEIARPIVAFAGSQIRNSLFMVVGERIFATLYFEKYSLSAKLTVFWWLTIHSYIVSFLYISLYTYANYYSTFDFFKFASLLFLFSTHFLTFIICTVLHYSNKKMYGKFAYQINLQQRYQIFENIKVLSLIYIPIIIYTLITPMASVVVIISGNIFQLGVPVCVFQIFCNLSFLIIIIHQIKHSPSVTPLNDSIVVNPFGKQLPSNVTNDKYFQELQQSWK